nr:HAMP domain-containing sensor histidine kinase [Marinobacterium sp. xm-d-530]
MATRSGSNLEPIAQAELPQDFLEVQRATNALLDRLRTALVAEREFAANSAHELRTPLAVASVQLQRLSDELGSTDQVERLKIVQSSLARLTRLIDKLLQLARAESVTLYKGEPTNLELIVKMIARELDPRNDRVEIISESPPLLDIDPDALAVILSNLVENGLKYAPNESPVIIRLESNGAFSVENLAPDLAPEDLNGLKQRFVRGNQRSQPGSGLGLAIVGAMVDQLNGDLDLKIAGEGRGKRLIVKVKI